MKTERLSFRDSYLRTCSAHVLSVERLGTATGVVFDRTVFYPTAGGQEHDAGRINGTRFSGLPKRRSRRC